MSTSTLSGLLDQLLPDSRVAEDVLRVLREELARGGFDGEPPESRPPADAVIAPVKKLFVRPGYAHAFGTHFICEVAIGGIAKEESGIVTPGYLFASLYYSDTLGLITVDFHDELR